MATQQRGPSMHDVAARAGVSHQTVSRVLNDFAGVKPATKERVVEAINALGYRRNLAARTLATGRSQSIGVLAPEVPNFGPMASLAAVERAAREAGFYSLVISTTPEPARVADALDYLLGKSIDALVLMAQQRSVMEAVTATAVGLPIVYLLTGGESDDWAVSVDQGAGVDIAVQHLVDLGHRRIQHIAGPLEFSEARLRREAFDRKIAANGLERLPLLVGDWSADSGYAAALDLDPTATAVFCANDQMALGAIHALVDGDLSVPDDVSVVGFDDLPEAKHSLPPLTTVHQDFEGVGNRAIEILLARLNEEACPTITPFQPWLVERSSTGPPRVGAGRSPGVLSSRRWRR